VPAGLYICMDILSPSWLSHNNYFKHARRKVDDRLSLLRARIMHKDYDQLVCSLLA
jgi:hypothetical protein